MIQDSVELFLGVVCCATLLLPQSLNCVSVSFCVWINKIVRLVDFKMFEFCFFQFICVVTPPAVGNSCRSLFNIFAIIFRSISVL